MQYSSIVSGLLYISSIVGFERKTQLKIAESLNISEITVRVSYKKIMDKVKWIDLWNDKKWLEN